MTKQTTLTIILAIIPSYLSLFCSAQGATILLCVTTMIGLVITGALSDEHKLTDKLRLAWILHLLSVCGAVAFHNIAG